MSLIRKKGKIETREVQDRLGLTKETTNMFIDFLVKFGFAEFDASKRSISLSKPCKRFFEEMEAGI